VQKPHSTGYGFARSILPRREEVSMWIEILLGVFAGLVLVIAAIVLAVRPELRARPKKSWMADPSGNEDRQPINGMGGDGA
jgi:hypothetical protein